MKWLRLAVACTLAAACGPAFSQDDPGRTPIGRVSVTVYYATNGDPQVAGKKTVKVSQTTEKRLRERRAAPLQKLPLARPGRAAAVAEL